jgi:tRNA-2-methylthio-N6-dimethylallyladenosine synthase
MPGDETSKLYAVSITLSSSRWKHQDTLSMMDLVKYDSAYMYSYSERPGTLAEKRYEDDVPEEVKKNRLTEIVAKQREHNLYRLEEQVGKTHIVLIEGFSRKSDQDFCGRNDQNSMVVFPVDDRYKAGDYVNVIGESCTSATLIGKIVE